MRESEVQDLHGSTLWDTANAMGEAGEVGKTLSSECLDEVAQTVRGILEFFRNWRTSGDSKIL